MESEETKFIQLPEPKKDSDTALEEALNARRSIRHYSDAPLTRAHISQLLWAAQGVTHARGFRTAPSAGALYPLEVYAVVGNAEQLDAGIYHYQPDSHRLSQVRGGDHRKALCSAGLSQSAIRNAPVSIIMSGVFERTTGKYDKRGVQYVFMEAGHAAQNVLLQAVALKLAAVPIGAFDNQAVSRLLDLPELETPLYILPVGRPK
ncbi:MAG: SagB/ThcOx family dehydrogenase [Desulfobacterales bacterium]